MSIPPYLTDLRSSIPRWVDRLRLDHRPGRYRFAEDAYEPCDIDSSHMMHNIVFTIANPAWPLPRPDERREWIAYLAGLQRREDGLLIDAPLERHIISNAAQPTADEVFTVRRWTSRNALMTVTEMGGRPRHRLRHGEVFASPEEMTGFLESLDWSLPWAAGSRTGAVVLFQHFNRLLGDTEAGTVIDAAVAWLVREQDPCTGAWFRGTGVPLHQMINGIMKIWIQLLPVTDLPLQYPEKVVDLCLRGLAEDPFLAEKLDACSLFDVALVLDTALRACAHRRDEVTELARTLLPRFERFVQADGAFSYFADRSLDNHGGLHLAPVKEQSDVVGTSLHGHAIALLASLAGWRDELGWSPLTEWRMRLCGRA